jgi:phage terminase large subunit-like protein
LSQPENLVRIEVCAKYGPLWNPSTRYVLVTGGRAAGKSFAVGLCMAMRLREPGHRILFTRYTLTSAKDSIIPEFLQKIDLLQCEDEFEATQASVDNLASGSGILFRGIKTSSGNQTAKLKSLQGINAWVVDEADEMPDEQTFDTIDLSVRDRRRKNLIVLVLNPCHKAHWIYQRFFKGRLPDGADVPPEFNGVVDGVTYIHATYEDNPHLEADYLELANKAKAANLQKYLRVWRGHWMDRADGALWTWDMIDKHRCRGTPPQFRRVVVAVDPAVTANADSDDTGIVGAGLGIDGHYYLLSDLTRRASPLEWANVAIAEYRARQADRIVGEVNNGGDLVEANLRTVDAQIPYTAVRASRGKIVRAEPIAALYEQGLVHHVGTFAQLETELMTYTGKANEASPNRMDAMVWALTELQEPAGVSEAAAADTTDSNGGGDAWRAY